MDIGTSGDQLAGEEESLCVLHEQVEPAACLPRQIPSKLLISIIHPEVIFIIHPQHLEHLQLLLTEQTDVEPGSQILLLNVICST